MTDYSLLLHQKYHQNCVGKINLGNAKTNALFPFFDDRFSADLVSAVFIAGQRAGPQINFFRKKSDWFLKKHQAN